MKKNQITRILAMLLTLVMVLSLAACGAQPAVKPAAEPAAEPAAKPAAEPAEEGGYADTIEFSMANYYTAYNFSSGYDYENDPMWKFICEKFNIAPELVSGEGWRDAINVWATAGTLPNIVWDDADPSWLRSFAEQGLFKPLPDDWKERWPDLAYMVSVSGMEEAYTIDGKLYAVPHAQTGRLAPAQVVRQSALLFRKDLAEAVGMPDFGKDGQCTLSELREYCEKVGEAGLTDKLLASDSFWIQRVFGQAFSVPGVDWAPHFVEIDGEFAYIPAMQGEKDMIVTLQEWYKAGIIDEEVYTGAIDYNGEFCAGNTAAYPYAFSVSDLKSVVSNITGFDPADLRVCVVTADDGSVGGHGVSNYWTAFMFAPETDEATFTRILDIINYFCTPEGIIANKAGVPGVTFEMQEDGTPKFLKEIDTAVVSKSPFYCTGYTDDFSTSGFDPNGDPALIAMYQACANLLAANVIPASYKYSVLSTEAAQNYSVDAYSKITEVMCSDVDALATWEQFLADNETLWQPVLDDLNA